jgi:16S rRNA U1498 N3-methylase RsmE
LRKHAQVSDHSTLVRAVVTAEMLDRMIQKAAELSDAY